MVFISLNPYFNDDICARPQMSELGLSNTKMIKTEPTCLDLKTDNGNDNGNDGDDYGDDNSNDDNDGVDDVF